MIGLGLIYVPGLLHIIMLFFGSIPLSAYSVEYSGNVIPDILVVVNGHEFQLVHKDVSVVDQVLSFCDEKSLDSNLCSLTKKAVFDEYASILNDDRVNLKPLPCFDSGLLGVHSIGDSHSQWTNDIFGSVSGEIEFFNHHLGPKLMYSFGRPNVYMNPHATHCIRPSDIVAFSFGEIDARCHLHKYYSGGQNIVGGIDDLVGGYMATIERNIATIDPLGATSTVWVSGVPPPVRSDIVFGEFDLPIIGNDNDRLLYALLMNQALQRECRTRGYSYIDIFSDYVNCNGTIDVSLSDGGVHIRTYTERTKLFIATEIEKHRDKMRRRLKV